MAINQTFEKRTDENGNEYMVLISEEFVPDPEPVLPTLEELQEQANQKIEELQTLISAINAKQYIENK